MWKEWWSGGVVAVLVGLSVIGCMQMGESPSGYEHDDDCLFCHTKYSQVNAKDIGYIYSNESAHHPVDKLYPPGGGYSEKFNLPNARQGKYAYFDTNANGRLDNDEVRLYPEEQGDEITCATCHRDHGRAPKPSEEPDDDFLRGTNADGELCLNCHRKPPRPILHQ
jgi:hypothetical protein